MKKRVLSLALAFMLLLSLVPVSAQQHSQYSASSQNYTFSSNGRNTSDTVAGCGIQAVRLDSDGQTVCNYDYTVPDGGVCVVLLVNPGCMNCQDTVKSIAASDWIGTDEMSVVLVDVSGGTINNMSSFAEECTGDKADCFTVFAQANYVGSKYGALLGISSYTTPLIMYITDDNGVPYIRRVSTGNSSESVIYSTAYQVQHSTDADSELTEVTVLGKRFYDEAEYGFEGINDMRTEKGLEPLSFSAELTELAMQRAEELALYYSNMRPDGSGFEAVFGEQSAGTKVGESHVFTTDTDDEGLWYDAFVLLKTGSTDNMLSADFTRMGVGIFKTDEGVYYVQLYDNKSVQEDDALTPMAVESSSAVSIRKEFLDIRLSADAYDSIRLGSSETLTLMQHNAESGLSVRLFPSWMWASSDAVDISTDDSGGVVLTGVSEGEAEVSIYAYDDEEEPCTVTRLVTTHEHSYTAVVTPATCTHGGYTTYTCDCGKSYVDDYTYGSHSRVTENAVAATDTESGYTGDVVCAYCGLVFEKGKVIPPLSHTHDYKAETIDGNCVRNSGTVYTCDCGDAYMDVDEKAPGHTMQDGVCTVCGYGVVQGNSDSALVSDNRDAHDYGGNHSDTVKSYIYEDSDGGIYRVEASNGNVTVEKYDSEFKYISSLSIPYALDIFGGFYSGSKYNYLVFGQENYAEDDTLEVVRVVKYSKSWQELGHLSVSDCNTTIPFRAGTLKMTENGDVLYIHTCHQMYTTADDLRHQANMQIRVNTDDMTLNSISMRVSNSAYGYVSHSFNQFIINDNGNIVTCDHGDGYPRAIMLYRYSDGKRSNVFGIYGALGANYTGVQVGGFEASDSHYIVVGTSIEQSENSDDASNVFVTATDKDMSETTLRWLSSYTAEEKVDIGNPQLVKLDGSRLLMMWTENEVFKYALLNADGSLASEIYSSAAMLSDCKPIIYNGSVLWYVTDSGTPYFLLLDPDAPEHITVVHNGVYGDDFDEYPRAYGGLGGDCTWTLTMSGKLTISGSGALLSPTETYIGSSGIEPPWYNYRIYIREVVIENGLEEICDGMFYLCRNLERVTIPWTVKTIGDSAFGQCSSLKSVKYMGDQEQWASVEKYIDNGLEDVEMSFHTHNYTKLDTVAPDCVNAGYTNYVCTACGYQKQGDIVAALGHDTELLNVRSATCTEAGYTGDEVCRTCGEVVKTGSRTALLAHKYSGGICTVCGQEKPVVQFTDVADSAYYAKPVEWAVRNDITGGYNDGTFRPMNVCTRAQIVTFIWRANGSPEPQGTSQGFTDVAEGTYYYKAVLWAAEKGITGGFDDGGFHPDEFVTRAQAMTFLWRAEGKPAVPAGTVNTFKDVPEGAYYHDAVLWAVANGITGGYDSITFGSMDGCTRAQIVTFLYRSMAE